MRFDKLVVNASPIISLTKIGCAGFLPALSSRLVVPGGVYQEIIHYKYPEFIRNWVNLGLDRPIKLGDDEGGLGDDEGDEEAG